MIVSTHNVVEGRQGAVRLATLALALRARLGLLASREVVEHLDDRLGCEVLLRAVRCERREGEGLGRSEGERRT